MKKLGCLVLFVLMAGAGNASAAGIDTAAVEAGWAGQRTSWREVGETPVIWRELLRGDGAFGGVSFTAPLDRKNVWALATDFTQLSKRSGKIDTVYITEQEGNRMTLQMVAHILWYRLSLEFEIFLEPEEIFRFRVTNEGVGEFYGYCRFQDAAGPTVGTGRTGIDLATHYKPGGLGQRMLLKQLMILERMALMHGIESFLDSCEARRARIQ
ncbi:MAG: hypothetical protein JW937_02165 [Candidatus Omnitrophica bacterium]|nr:hypothetical protein [Candidatus Omnitrophota bacterium]